jgi:hypothetical protein
MCVLPMKVRLAPLVGEVGPFVADRQRCGRCSHLRRVARGSVWEAAARKILTHIYAVAIERFIAVDELEKAHRRSGNGAAALATKPC